jgi:hypothetical protein
MCLGRGDFGLAIGVVSGLAIDLISGFAVILASRKNVNFQKLEVKY